MPFLSRTDLAAAPRPPLRVGLLGIGVVGSGVHRLLQRNRALIEQRAGRPIELRKITARNLERARALANTAAAVVGDPMSVVTDPDIDVVVEVIGGCTTARELVMTAIAQGKHVVTANKALLAHHGEEVFEAASRHGVVVAFEGAVAVSIPIIKALREGLAANRIEWLAGIVNGTSNFILTRMRDDGLSFDAALREAQRLGYAEADPSFDVDGIDSAHKLALLASLAFGMPVSFERIAVEGIRDIQLEDLLCAERLGYRVKLLASARRHGGRVDLNVQPCLVPLGSLMAGVDGAMNGILVQGDAAGQTMFYGAGAGSLETASAVVADLMEVARAAEVPAEHRVPALAIPREQAVDLPWMAPWEVSSPYFLRMAAACDVDFAAVRAAFAVAGIDIVEHQSIVLPDSGRSLAWITQVATRPAIDEVIRRLLRQHLVEGPVVCLRVACLQSAGPAAAPPPAQEFEACA